jgi:pyruvate formate lyase activating enzyme
MNTATDHLQEARYWDAESQGRVRCRLCAHYCLIAAGNAGLCKVRKNIDGKLYAMNYGRLIAVHSDPIEKKPLYHFLPGSNSFSIASPGCNMGCDWCQNWQISQADQVGNLMRIPEVQASKTVKAAQEFGAASIAYTYTEPVVFYEYARETGLLAKEAGLKNIFITNGMTTLELAADMADWLDAVNIDLKAFDEDVYRKYMHGNLAAVLEVCKALKTAGVWLEITTLLVPGVNDDQLQLQNMVQFIAEELGKDTPWHISRYFPQYKFSNAATPVSSIEKAEHLGRLAGLRYIYPGNLSNTTQTLCPECNKLLIDRDAYRVVLNSIEEGRCPRCKTVIPGVWA